MADVQIAEVLVSVALDPNSPLQAQAKALLRQFEAEGKRMEQTLGNSADRALGQLAAAGKRVASSLTSAFGAVSASLAGIAATSLVTGANFNNLQAKSRKALTTILKGSKEAEAVLADVNKLVDESPFARPIFLEATQQLLAFGLEAKKVVPVLDAAQQAVAAFGGSGADLQQIIGVFSRISSQGRITGDDLRSLQLQGIEAAELIGVQFGKTGEEIRDEVSKGAIDAGTAIDALTKGIQDRFGGATEGLRQTFDGAKDRLQAALRDIGANLTATLISPTGAAGGGFLVEAINNIATGLRNIQKTIVPQLVPAFTAIGQVLANATAAFANFTETLKENEGGISKVLDLMKAFAPVAALAGAAAFQSFSQNIPVLAGFASALNGPLIAFALFAATNDDVRAAVTGLLEALQPAIQRILPTLLVIFEQLSSIVGDIAGRVITSLTPSIVALAESLSLILQILVPVLDVLAKLTPLIAPLVTGFLAFKGVELVILATSAALNRMAASALLAGRAVTTATGKMGALNGVTKVAQGAASATASKLAGLAGKFAVLGAGVARFAGPIGIAASIGIPLLASAFGKSASEAEKLEARITALDSALVGVTSKAEQADIVFENLFTKDQQDSISLTSFEFEKLETKVKAATKALQEAKDAQLVSNLQAPDESGRSLGPTVEDDVATASVTNLTDAKKVLADVNKDIAASEKAVAAAVTENNAAILKEAILSKTTGETRNRLLRGLDKGIERIKTATKETEELAEANKVLFGTTTLATQGLEEEAKAAKALADSTKSAFDALVSNAQSIISNLQSTQSSLSDAREEFAATQKELNTLTAEYNALLATSAVDINAIADAEEDLLGVRRSLRDLDQSRLDLLEQLAELNTPSDADDIVSAQDKVTKSQISYNQLLREQAAVEDVLTPKTKKRLNLQGLSLDEVRSNLRNVREALAAQKDGAEDEKEQKDDFLTVDEKRILAEIEVRDAAQQVTDAKETLLGLQNRVLDNSEDIRDIEQQIVDLDEDRIGLLGDEQTAIIAIQTLREGDKQRAEDLKQIEEDIKQATIDRETAVGKIKTLEGEIATIKSNALLTEDQKTAKFIEQNEKLLAQLGLIEDIKTAQDAAAEAAGLAVRAQVSSFLGGPGALSVADLPPTTSGSGGFSLFGTFGSFLSDALKDPASALKQIIDQLIAEILKNAPGNMAGGIVTGSGSFGTLIRAGEYGKHEAVLPLTSTTNALSTLQSGLKYMTPELRSILGPSLGMGSAQPLLSLSGSRGGGANYNADRIGPGERELLDLLRDIRDGVSNNSGGQVNNFEITAQGHDANVVSRKVVQEIQRKLDRL